MFVTFVSHPEGLLIMEPFRTKTRENATKRLETSERIANRIEMYESQGLPILIQVVEYAAYRAGEYFCSL